MSASWTFPPMLALFCLLTLWACQTSWRVDTRIDAHQHIHNELLRLEALALTRLPWYVNTTSEQAIPEIAGAPRVPSELERRTDPNQNDPGQSDLVLSLWKNAQTKVPVNNMFVEYAITPDKTVVMTTATCFGCTAVVICSVLGKLCIFAHFRQENGGKEDTWPPGPSQDVQFSINVLDPINAAIKQYHDQLAAGEPYCVIFTPGSSQNDATVRSFYYRARIEGPGSINDAITTAFPSSTILNIGYNYMRSLGDMADQYGWGKLVLEWKGAASSCAVDGKSVLNVFAEDNWWTSMRFDDDGISVNIDNTACQPPTGAQDVFGPDA